MLCPIISLQSLAKICARSAHSAFVISSRYHPHPDLISSADMSHTLVGSEEVGLCVGSGVFVGASVGVFVAASVGALVTACVGPCVGSEVGGVHTASSTPLA